MKTFLTITLSLAMLCTAFTTPIGTKAAHLHVHEEQVDAVITPYAAICSNCGTGRILQKTTYGDWLRETPPRTCIDGYAWGQDIKQTRTVTITLKCNTCGVGYSYQTTPQTEWLCFGFN